MFEILNKQILANQIKRIDVRAPNIASKIRPGQFVSVSPEESMERIPLSVAEFDPLKGTVSLIFHEVGTTTKKLGALPINESIFSILGPLGIPATIEKRGVIVCIATGIGAAQILPIARALKKLGNKVIGIIGAKTKRSLMLEAQMRLACNRLFITTNDGSYEKKGLATDVLVDLMNQKQVDLVYAIGSADMMEGVASITKNRNVETFVHLNPIMVDCMGMCGSCRVKVGEKIVLTCIEGPEFDGHLVDFKDYQIRMNAFKEQEQWRNQKLSFSQKNGEEKTLTKLLSGILKETP